MIKQFLYVMQKVCEEIICEQHRPLGCCRAPSTERPRQKAFCTICTVALLHLRRKRRWMNRRLSVNRRFWVSGDTPICLITSPHRVSNSHCVAPSVTRNFLWKNKMIQDDWKIYQTIETLLMNWYQLWAVRYLRAILGLWLRFGFAYSQFCFLVLSPRTLPRLRVCLQERPEVSMSTLGLCDHEQYPRRGVFNGT